MKTYLFSPGPVMVEEPVRQSLLHYDICHRSPEFEEMIVSGSERILTAPIEAGEAITDYDAEKDICMYACSEQIRTIDLNAGRLAILFPENLHAPGNSIADSVFVKKVVFKIPIKEGERCVAAKDRYFPEHPV